MNLVARVLVTCFGLAGVATMHGCTCKCPPLSINQKEAVGTFMSLSMDPLNEYVPMEVAPARIRANRGEEVIWIFRNPSREDVELSLLMVRDPGAPDRNIMTEVFQSPGKVAPVKGNCGYGWLSERLRTDIELQMEMGTEAKRDTIIARGDTCASRLFYYDFLIASARDTDTLAVPYDPELVVEREP